MLVVVYLFVYCELVCFVFFKQKTAYEMRISDWSSDVCSSDLLQRLVLLQDRLDRAGGFIMFLADDAGFQNATGRVQRVDRRIDAQFRNGAVENGGGVKVREGGRGRRVGHVVRGAVAGLHRGEIGRASCRERGGQDV